MPQVSLPLLQQIYRTFDTPVDTLATQPERLEQFTLALAEATDQRLSTSEVVRVLMNARKRGNLPRLRRRYNGRYVSKEVQDG